MIQSILAIIVSPFSAAQGRDLAGATKVAPVNPLPMEIPNPFNSLVIIPDAFEYAGRTLFDGRMRVL
jgi:hypothetical protein